MGEEDDLDIKVNTNLPKSLQHHGEKINKIKDHQACEQLVEKTVKFLSCEDVDGEDIAKDSKTADGELQHSLQHEAQQGEVRQVFQVYHRA